MARIWRAGTEEAQAVAALLVAFRDHLGRDWPSANAFLGIVERLIERGESEFLLGAPAETDAPVAVAQLRFRFGIWWAAPDCALEDLFVEERARGTGLGRAMVQAAIARAEERGCRRIELDTGEDNAAARALYEGSGFSSGSGADGSRQLFYRRRLGDGA
jgi:GNAT superfamily N-acetyltransferase